MSELIEQQDQRIHAFADIVGVEASEHKDRIIGLLHDVDGQIGRALPFETICPIDDSPSLRLRVASRMTIGEKGARVFKIFVSNGDTTTSESQVEKAAEIAHQLEDLFKVPCVSNVHLINTK